MMGTPKSGIKISGMKRHSALCGLLIVTLCLAAAETGGQAEGAPSDSVDFQPTVVNDAPPPSPPPRSMVWIPGGEFSMGSEDPRVQPSGGHEAMADARPIHRVYVDGFWMDATDVTNAEFARFVAATGYITVAERKPIAAGSPMPTRVTWSQAQSYSLLRRSPYLSTIHTNGGVMCRARIGVIPLALAAR